MFIEKNVVNGIWFETKETIAIQNPATKEILGVVPKSGAREAEQAVDAAADALVLWSSAHAYERSRLLKQWHDLIEENKEILSRIMTMEQGKPLTEAAGEINYANQYVEWYAEEAKRLYGELIPASSTEKRLFVQKVPVGVVAAITPWNFPAAMVTRKLAPALAAGCTVVLKPSEETPFTALKLAELAERAGIPKGVINVLTGDAKEIAEVWQKDARVRKITFTGSTPVGKLLMKNAADTMKKLSLELGGQAPFIVTNKADIDAAVQGAIQSKFRNGGQACVAANRFLVQEDAAEEFIAKFTEQTADLKYGNGLESDVSVGPLINQKSVAKIEEHVKDAIQKGGKVLTGGSSILEEKGFFYQPTVLANASDDMLCMNEETFGPVAPVSTFKTLDEAIERANNTPYGLAAYVFSQDINEALYIVERLEYGVIGLNDGLPSAAQAPFGGFKESGIGREGGKQGIEDFLEDKYISLGSIK
ncbi:NAD-dependent succinate-semialdehyde dehydrogenase [Bacillus sp. MUM 13]|uniref:NAD-dependent succinate-semialdehyde dehydrogenase n=1 Tax=Bacillus sp. MUM 13 TaxID=1678001 RepID=UPI0008F5DD22|nr:NAD-dependent succinate-semialdehyde dehydrogenase [Bacillus sp. MUM 13]OIK12220.1 succinate-semialdehyde dehydrogenase (NADP(+)) [Bacillus sp. MUM 13]